MSFRLYHGVCAASFAATLLCLPVGGMAQGRGGNAAARQAALDAAAQKPTPKTADGHPDLDGYWDAPNLTPDSFYKQDDGKTTYLFGKDFGGPKKTLAAPPPDPNPPSYKPEFQDKVKDLGIHSESAIDPAWNCKSLGVPRLGPPRQIVQAPGMVVFIYQIDAGSGTTPGNEVRVVPTDGRPHRTDVDPTPWGDSIGHWEGDTLVVDTTGISTDNWMGSRGYIHSRALHVTERITRKGDTLHYEATAEDPNMLTKPWALTPRTLIYTNEIVVPNPVCSERDTANIQ